MLRLTLLMPIYGTRPEAIKMAPVIKALEDDDRFSLWITVTGQHREMLDQVNDLFGIVPDTDLNIIEPRQTLAGITERTLNGLTSILEERRPDAVLVQGDTTTSMAAALAAAYLKIPVMHIEAGLRSGMRHSPFPEEINRKITGQLSDLHLAPTPISKQNLLNEGIDEASVLVTGNTVIDALIESVQKRIPFTDPVLAAKASNRRPKLLVTAHRRENQGSGMHNIGRALARLATSFPDWDVIIPIHRNPVVREAILPYVDGIESVCVTEPVDYGQFTHLLGISSIVLTDSGGVQEEAPSLGKPVIVMRDNTERPEAVTAGTVRLVGTDEDLIVDEVTRLITDADWYKTMANAVNPYGDGKASERIVASLAEFFDVGIRLADFEPTL